MSATAWTHTITYDDVERMLALAEPGAPVAAWRAAVNEGNRLLASDRRTSQFRIATAILSPIANTIVNDGFLADWQAGDARTRRDLIFARYLANTPLAVAGAHALFFPALRAGRATIERDDIEAALSTLLPTQRPTTLRRSRTAFRTEFARAGIVTLRRDGAMELTGYRPSPVAVLHLIRDDLRERREASDAWLATSSLAAAVFALPPNALRDDLETLVRDGRLQRSYYSGEPRILAA